MDLGPFLMVDALFLVGLTWWFWKRSSQRTRRTSSGGPLNQDDEASVEKVPPSPLPVRRILFSGNTATLSRGAVADLDTLANWLKSTNAALELTGSADDTGHLAQNRQLAKARASVALRALLAHGIAAQRLVVRTLEPARGTTEKDRQALRCVSFRHLDAATSGRVGISP